MGAEGRFVDPAHQHQRAHGHGGRQHRLDDRHELRELVLEYDRLFHRDHITCKLGTRF